MDGWTNGPTNIVTYWSHYPQQKVFAELSICFLSVFIVVLLRHGAKTMTESANFDISDA